MEPKTKKNLLLVTAGFPYGESEQSFLRAEFQKLCQVFQVTVLAVEPHGAIIYEIPEGVTVEQFTLPALRRVKTILDAPHLLDKVVRQECYAAKNGCGIKLYAKRIGSIAATYLNALSARETLAQIIIRDKIELIYTYWCTPMTLAALLLKKQFPHLKVVTRFHGMDLYNERADANWQPFRKWISEEADKLIFACEMGKNYYLTHWANTPPEKTMVSYLGCRRLGRIQPKQSDFLQLVSCSNVISLKRIHLIIEALALLPDAIRVEWHHIGDGAEMGNMKQLASQLLTARTNVKWRFLGYVANHQLEEVYNQIQPHLFITTSATEGGAPVSIQEIFSAGIPAIGTAVGGIPELIQIGKTGYLLSDSATPSEIAEAVMAFYHAEPRQRQDMQEAVLALWEEKLDAVKNAELFSSRLEQLLDYA